MSEPKPEPVPAAETKPEPPKAKRPYVAPKVTDLGSVKSLTRTGGTFSVTDNPTAGTFKIDP